MGCTTIGKYVRKKYQRVVQMSKIFKKSLHKRFTSLQSRRAVDESRHSHYPKHNREEKVHITMQIL